MASLFRRDALWRRMSMSDDHVVDNSVVKWIDIFILLCVCIIAIVLLPQTVTRFRTRSEWWKGIILYQDKTTIRDDSSSITARNSRDQPSVAQLKSGRKDIPHARSLGSRFPFVAKVLRYHLPFPGAWTFGKAFLLILYFSTLLFAALYRDSVFNNSIREGAIVASQLPWVYMLASKNNIIGTMTGRGYEKLNYIHRMAGRLTVLAANVHALGFIYKWVIAGTWTQETQKQLVRWGLVTLVTYDLLFLTSMSFIRKNYYNFFYATHSIMTIMALVSISIHAPFAVPYVSIAAGFWGVDHVLRLAKTRVPEAQLEAVPELHTTLVRVPTLNAGWRAGQFVRVRVLSRGMGWTAWAEPHAFTIASAGEYAGGDGLVLMVKRHGRWSRALYDLAAEGQGAENEKGLRRVRVQIEGPYGGPGNTVFSSFSGAFFVCGGSGISFGLAAVQELLQRISQGTSNVCTIDLVWCITHARAVNPLLSPFSSLLTQSHALPVELTIQVYYTRALNKGEHEKYPALDALPRGLALAAGRAATAHLLSEFVVRTATALGQDAGGAEGWGRAHGVLVGACGPVTLSSDVRRAIGTLDAEDMKSVGGVQFHDESFSL